MIRLIRPVIANAVGQVCVDNLLPEGKECPWCGKFRHLVWIKNKGAVDYHGEWRHVVVLNHIISTDGTMKSMYTWKYPPGIVVSDMEWGL